MDKVYHYRVEFEDGVIVDTDTRTREEAAIAARYQTQKTGEDRIARIERVYATGSVSSA